MRLKHTPLIALLLLAVVAAGTAIAATATKRTVSTTLRGHLAPGIRGKLQLTTTHKRAGTRVGVTISYDVNVRSKTVLAFAAYPCRSTSCSGKSTSTITLGAALRHVKFHGSVPYVKRASGNGCVYAQLRDLGPRGKGTGTIVRNGASKGVLLCQSR